MPRPIITVVAALTALVNPGVSSWNAAAQSFGGPDAFEIQLLTHMGKPERAIEKAKEALDTLGPAANPQTLDLVGRVLTFLCEAHTELGEYQRAVAACLEAVAAFERATDPSTTAESNKYLLAFPQLAGTYEAMGEYQAALDVREKQLARVSDGRPSNPEKVLIQTQIGDLHLALRHFREAEAAYLAAVADFTKVWHANRRPHVMPHQRLASLYRLEERFDEAEATAREALAELERVRKLMSEIPSARASETHYEVNQPLLTQSLAWISFHQGRLDEAQTLALALLGQLNEAGHEWNWLAADMKVLLGQIEDAMDPGSAEAERYLLSAVTASKPGDPGNIFHAMTQMAIAHHHLLAGNLVAAEPYAQMAVRTLDWGLGTDNYITARARVTLAQVLKQQGKHAEALAPAAIAYAAQRTALPPYHRETGETLALLAVLYEALDRHEDLAATQELIAQHQAARTKFESGK